MNAELAKEYFKEFDETLKIYDEIKYMHPEDQEFVLSVYLDEELHEQIPIIIETWNEELKFINNAKKRKD